MPSCHYQYGTALCGSPSHGPAIRGMRPSETDADLPNTLKTTRVVKAMNGRRAGKLLGVALACERLALTLGGAEVACCVRLVASPDFPR